MRRRAFLTGCAASAVVPLITALSGCSTSPAQAHRPAMAGRITRTVRYAFSLQNPTGTTLSDQRLWFYAPVGTTATQELRQLTLSMPHQQTRDAVGNTIVELPIAALPPYATKLVQIAAELSIRPGRSNSAGKLDLFLGEERFVEVNDPAIATLAAQLRREAPLSTARAIYDWVKDNIRYQGYVAEDLGARKALSTQAGDCTECAYLVCALARANQIPARVLGGYVSDRDLVLEPSSYHNWAELWLDDHWFLVDAQKASFGVNPEHYLAFQIFSSRAPNALQGYHRFRAEGSMQVRMA